MANVVCNVAKGRIVEFYKRVVDNDPANSAFILIPVATAGLEADSVLIDKQTVADFFSGTTSIQSTLPRVTITNAELAALSAPNTTGDYYSAYLPDFGYVSAAGAAISKLLVAFDYDTAAGTDATLIPCAVLDFALTPDGNSVSVTGGEFHRST